MTNLDKPSASTPVRRKYDHPDLRVLIFLLAGQEYVIDVNQVQEITTPTGLMPMAGLPNYIAGVIKRRKRIIPVIDLRKRLDLPERGPDDTCWVLITKQTIGLVGFAIDMAVDLMWVKTQDFEIPSVVVAPIDQVYLQGIGYFDDRVLIMLDLSHLLPASQNGDSVTEEKGLTQPTHTWGTLFSGETQPAVSKRDSLQRTHNLVVFELGHELYGVATTDVAEIREVLPIMPLPNVPSHILGLINQRGTVLPVLDLRRKFKLPINPPSPNSALIILRGEAYWIALWVDRLHELVRLPHADFQPVPAGVIQIDAECCVQVTTLNGHLLVELDVNKLLALTAFEGDPSATKHNKTGLTNTTTLISSTFGDGQETL